jgi:type II secretory pathway component GspD/PulD (secretin)
VVLDGEGTSLDVGRKIPIIINAVNNLGGDAGELQILDASNILQVIPQVVDDEAGNPIAVNLIMRLESNDVDSSVVTQGVPAIARRSIQSRIILNEEKTVILGGFTVDSDSNTTSKAPGLGDIPGLGWLFKRKVRSTQINRLYFALSVSIVPFGQMIEPVSVPGANTDIPSLTPPMKDRSDKAEPQQVVALPTPKGP